MAMLNQSKLSYTYKIILEALTIITKNFRSILPILLFSLLFSSLSSLSNYLSTTPIVTKLTETFTSFSDPTSPERAFAFSIVRDDLRQITIIQSIFLFVNFIFSSFTTIALIHVISMAYSDKQVTLTELISLVKRTWKGPMLTQLFVTIIILAAGGFIFFLIIAFIFISIGSITYSVAAFLLSVFAFLLYIYLEVICSLSVVVSVEEEGCYGLSAIEKSVELLQGRRQEGVLIVFVFAVMNSLILAVYSFSMLLFSGTVVAVLVIGFAYLVVLMMVRVLSLAAIVVFYSECKNGGRCLIAMEGNEGYCTLSSDVDPAIP